MVVVVAEHLRVAGGIDVRAEGGLMTGFDESAVLRGIASSASSLIVVADVSDTVTWVSPSVHGLLGIDDGDASGLRGVELLAAGSLPERSRRVRRVLAGGVVAPFADECRVRDGRLLEVDVTVGPVEDAEGRVVGTVTTLRPVSADPREHGEAESALRRARVGLQQAAPPLVVVGLDETVVSVDRTWCELLDAEPGELVGRSVLELVHPVSRPMAEQQVRRFREGRVDSARLELVVRGPRGTAHPLLLDARVLRDATGAAFAVGVSVRDFAVPAEAGSSGGDVRAWALTRRAWEGLRDATERVENEQALRYSESLHRAIVENVQEGILATADDGSTILANERLADLLGLPLSALYEQDVRALLGRHFEEGQPEVTDIHRDSYEKLYATADRGGLVLSVTRSPLRTSDPERPEVLGALYVVGDLTDTRSAEAELRRQALHDPLTGLPNRYLLLDRIAMARARADRSEAPSTAMLFVDLDGFKAVNDSFGHQTGDQVLVEVAHRFKASVRGSDTVARIGGDEFAILCEGTGELGALLVAERIQEALQSPVVTEDGVQHHVRLSVGVSVSPPAPFPDLLRLADDAMYDAKQHGGARTALSPLVG